MGAAGGGRRDSGFTYLSLMFIILVIGIGLAVTGQVWSTIAKREKEAALIYAGGEIKRGIGAYYALRHSYPRELEVLLKEPSQPAVTRYLRKIYLDPMTGRPDWELIKSPDGAVTGVRSSSRDETLKKDDFPLEFSSFRNKTSYNEWEFIFVPSR